MQDKGLTTDLWLVRHGQTDWNIQGRYQGQSNTHLNETGLAQAQALAQELLAEQQAGKKFAAIYASDLQRATKTAEILAEALGLSVRVDPRLREINQGEWEGKDYRSIVAQYRELLALRSREVISNCPPGGEFVAEVAGRMRSAADEIAAAHPGEAVLVVSHGVAMACLIAEANGLPLQDVYSKLPHNTHPELVRWPAREFGEISAADGR